MGFRAFTKRHALEFELRGWVRNLQDGRVEALAQGSQINLTQFEAELKKGPAHGHVDSLMIRSLQPAESLTGFTLKKDGSEPWSEN